MKTNRYRGVWLAIFLLPAFIARGGISRLFGGDEKVAWRETFPTAQTESASSGKPVFLYFTASWCGPCQQMKRSTWSDQNVADALAAGFIPVRIDIDQQPDLAQQYGVESIPWFAVLDDAGRATRAYTGAVSSDEFLDWLAR